MLWYTNPKYHLWPEADALFDLFFLGMDSVAWSNGATGVSALKHLPGAGGLSDQCRPLLEALSAISRAVREWQGGRP